MAEEDRDEGEGGEGNTAESWRGEKGEWELDRKGVSEERENGTKEGEGRVKERGGKEW
jgi:hypothetical protein